MKKVKNYLTVAAVFALSLVGLTTIPANTQAISSICDQPNVSQDIKNANGCGGAASEDLQNVIINIINGFVGVLSVVAVIVIVVGGVQYMTSAGDAGKVEKAKKTILYATIGLVVCVLAFAIVNFVVANLINGGSSSGGTPPASGGGPV